MVHSVSIFFAFLAAIHITCVVSFTGVSHRPSLAATGKHRGVHAFIAARSRSSPHATSDAVSLPTTLHDIRSSATVATGSAKISMPRRIRWRTRIGASTETVGGEGEASTEESDAANAEAGVPPTDTPRSAPVGQQAGLDLSKGIAFETPKPKALEPEQEEESESKKAFAPKPNSNVDRNRVLATATLAATVYYLLNYGNAKVRVILYTVLSLVPFVLLLPFLGSRELLPLDPSQM